MKIRRGHWLFVALVGLLVAVAIGLRGYLRNVRQLSDARSIAVSQQPETAVDYLESLHAKQPENAEVAYLLAVAHRRIGQTKKAEEDLKLAGELGWSRRDVQRQHFMIRFQSGEIVEAEPRLLEIIDEGCDDDLAVQIYECLIKGYLADARLADAVRCADHWVEWQPDSAQAHVMAAEIFDALQDKPALEKEYRKILALDPGHRKSRMRLGFLLLEAKKAPEANDQFDEYLQRWPDDGIARMGWASCQREMGNLKEARAAFEQAITEDLPAVQRGFVLSELGQLAMAEKDYERARDYLQQAVEAFPSNHDTHYTLAMVLSRLGDQAAADEHLEKSRELGEEKGRFEEAISEILRHPDDAARRCEAGEILLNQGKREEGFAWLLSSLRCDRWYAPTHKVLARYYADVGDQKMAQQHLVWSAQSDELAKTGQGDAP